MKNFILLFIIPGFLFSQNCEALKREYTEVTHSSMPSSQKIVAFQGILNKLQQIPDTLNSCYSELSINLNFSLFDYYLDNDDLDRCLNINSHLNNINIQEKLTSKQMSHFLESEAHLYYCMGDFTNSLRKNNELLQNYNSELNNKNRSEVYDLMGNSYLKLFKQTRKKQYLDSSNYYFHRGYSALKKDTAFDFQDIKGNYYKNKIEYYLAINDYQNALKFANRALIANNNLDLTNPLLQNFYLQKGSAFLHSQQYDSVIKITRQLKNYLGENQFEERVKLYDLNHQAFLKLGRKDSANHFLNLNYEMLTSLNQAKSNSLKQLYGIDIQQLEAENKQQSSINKNKSWSIGILLLLIGAMIVVFYLRNRNEKEKYEKLFQEKYQELQFLKKEDESQDKKSSKPSIKNPLTDELVKELDEKLNKVEEKSLYLNPDFTLNYLSKKLGTNTSYLSYYFNHIRKQSFPNYVNHLRVNYILEELNQNPKFLQYSMEGLAKESGFKDASVFSKMFKRIVGIPPSYYVENLIKEKKKLKKEVISESKVTKEKMQESKNEKSKEKA